MTEVFDTGHSQLCYEECKICTREDQPEQAKERRSFTLAIHFKGTKNTTMGQDRESTGICNLGR